MTWFVFVFAYCVLSFSTVPVVGQCTVSSCAVSVSGSEESLQASLEEHGHRLETMNQNMCLALEKLEAAVNRTNARGQEELCQDLKTLYYNMSINLERVERHIQAVNESLSATLQNVNRSLDEKFQVMKMQLSSLINESVSVVLRELQEKFQTLNEALSSAIDKNNEKPNATIDRVKESNQSVSSHDHCQHTSGLCDCSDIKANGHSTSGVYRIYVVDEGQRYYANASCDMTTTNGPWTVFQRRKDGSVDFYRGWNEYANGFGNPNGEFWLGNNFLHLLTSKKRYRMRIDLEDFEGGKRYAEYSTFNISSSADKYRLRIGTYSGTAAGDCLRVHNGHRFSTKDNDNDPGSGNCAVIRCGAWWYNECNNLYSNLNGLYLRGRYLSNGSFNGFEGINWYHWHWQWYSLKTTEMKISSS